MKIGEGYKPNRNSQRIARYKVLEYINLEEENIVHHDDKDCFNNHISNLFVFRNNGDHVRYHRGFDVEPIWRGDLISKR